MLNYSGVEKTQTEKFGYLPNINLLMKISLGLILFTIISTALVYAETESVIIDGNSYDVNYTVTGMTVSGIEADLDAFSLIITVDTSSSGTMEITLDRSFLDSLYDADGVILDDEFFILADGDYTNFAEISTTSESRTLSVEVPMGTVDIEIIGTIFANSEVEETPVEETLVEETPVEETLVEETPVEETLVEETPRTQCGPGTVLQDGACILDERCGPGTILEGGVCVLDSTSVPTSTSSKGLGKELIMGVVVAIAIAGAIGIILAIISKASKSSD